MKEATIKTKATKTEEQSAGFCLDPVAQQSLSPRSAFLLLKEEESGAHQNLSI
jgi:hypothetical protein